MESESGKCVMDAPPAADVEEVTDDVLVLGREEILAIEDIGVVLVDVPEWGGQVFVRMISGRERDEFDVRIYGDRPAKVEEETQEEKLARLGNLRALVAALTISDKDGNPLFTVEDVEKLGEKSGAALDRVFAVATELNGLSPADIEELRKNCDSGRNDDSGSSSA